MIWQFVTIHSPTEWMNEINSAKGMSSHWIQSAQWHRMINCKCDQYFEKLRHIACSQCFAVIWTLSKTLWWTLPQFRNAFKWIRFLLFSTAIVLMFLRRYYRFLFTITWNYWQSTSMHTHERVAFTFHIPSTRNPSKWLPIHRWEFNLRPTLCQVETIPGEIAIQLVTVSK